MKPLKESGPGRAALENLRTDNSGDPSRAQLSQETLRVWGREGARLLGLFWSTGQRRHLIAFAVHMIGLRDRITRGV